LPDDYRPTCTVRLLFRCAAESSEADALVCLVDELMRDGDLYFDVWHNCLGRLHDHVGEVRRKKAYGAARQRDRAWLSTTGETREMTLPPLDRFIERKRVEQDETLQRSDQRRAAHARLTALAKQWDQVQSLLESPSVDEESAQCLIDLVRLLQAEDLVGWFDDAGSGRTAFEPDEDDARRFVVDLLSYAGLRNTESVDRKKITSSLRATQGERVFCAAVQHATALAGRQTTRILKERLAAQIGCAPGDPSLDIEYASVSTNSPGPTVTPEFHEPTGNGPAAADGKTHFPAAYLDPSRCPGCDSDVPVELSVLPLVPCPSCQRWELHTGVEVVPVAAPTGTPPEVVRSTAPYWQARVISDERAPVGNVTAKRTSSNKRNPKGGRPQVASPEEDEKTFNDWKASDRTQKDFARARGLKLEEVEKACSRYRARRSRAKKEGRKPRTN
jgi:hypothetical protein